MKGTQPFSQHLADLRTATLRLVIPISGLLAYLWLVWALWPIRAHPTPPEAWLGGIILATTTLLSVVLMQRHPRNTALLLLGGLIGAIACAVATFRTADVLHLLIVPVILTGAVFAPWVVIVVGAVVSCLSALLVLLYQLEGVSVFTPSITFALVILVAISSARSLRVMLVWALADQQEAARNERIARDRKAELVQVLRSLDTATYNLERTNYLLASARNQAEEAWRLKQQFAQNISHELRTPLNLVVGFTETMIQSPEYYGSQLPAPYLRDLTIVYRNARHLQNLVNDVLDLARIESAQMTLVTERTNISELLFDIISNIKDHIERRHLAVHCDIPLALPYVDIDPVRIRQVVLNLLNNGMRFTEHGSLTIQARNTDNSIVVSVIDTGIGIPPHELERIFDAFHQVDNTMQRRQGGAGLGLTISKRFVEMHGGKMWVKSEPGKGSAFSFSLPTEQGLSSVASSYASLVPERKSSKLIRERLVLVVTGSPSAATMLSRYLRDCRPIFVNNLEEAQRIAQHSIPQLVLIDTSSIPLSPAQFDILARNWGLTNTSFACCALPGEERSRHRLATSGYLVKPISRETLRDVLTRLGDSISRVLVVDDDPDFVRLITRMLNTSVRRYQVFSAYSGQEGFQMAQHYQPDVVLMDLGLPDIDGLTLLDQIRSHSLTQQIPIIIVSAHDEPDAITPLPGPLIVTRSTGLFSGEIMQWLQKVLDTTTHNVEWP